MNKRINIPEVGIAEISEYLPNEIEIEKIKNFEDDTEVLPAVVCAHKICLQSLLNLSSKSSVQEDMMEQTTKLVEVVLLFSKTGRPWTKASS